MLTITNNNIYHSEFSLSALSSLDKAEIIHVNEITSFLSDSVELGESVTFKRLFEIVSANAEKFNEIFYSALGGYKLGPYLQEIENNPTESSTFDFLEIHWFSDKYEDELNISPSLHGVNIKTNDFYALDFTSLNNLKNYVVKINESVEIFEYIPFEKPKKTEKIVLGDKYFTLFDLFCGIFFEISFHGGPQDKKERFNEIEESIIESENTPEELREFTTFEEMMEEFDTKDEYLVKYNDIRLRVEEDRVTNKKNLPKLKNCLLEKLKIYDIIEKSDEDEDLRHYYKKLTDIEYNMQLLYGEDEDIMYHKFWETPNCTCPKIDNLEIYPSDKPYFDNECQIHKK